MRVATCFNYSPSRSWTDPQSLLRSFSATTSTASALVTLRACSRLLSVSKLSVATCKRDVSEMGHINEGKSKLHHICIYITILHGEDSRRTKISWKHETSLR